MNMGDSMCHAFYAGRKRQDTRTPTEGTFPDYGIWCSRLVLASVMICSVMFQI